MLICIPIIFLGIAHLFRWVFSIFRYRYVPYGTFQFPAGPYCMIYNFRCKPSFPSLVIPFQISLRENMLNFSPFFLFFQPLQDRLTASVKKTISHTPFSCQLFFIIFSSFFVISKKKWEKSLAATYFPADAVSSALESLTSVFGMGTGITSPLWSLAFLY